MGPAPPTPPSTSAAFQTQPQSSPTATLSGPTQGIVGQTLSFTVGATESGQTSFSYDVSWGDTTADTIVSGPSGTTVTHTYTQARAGTGYSVAVTATDSNNNTSQPQIQGVGIQAITTDNILAAINTPPAQGTTVAFEPANSTDAQTILNTLQSLSALPTGVSVALNLGNNTIPDVHFPAGVIIVNGGVIVGNSPALIVSTGDFDTFNGTTFTTSTAAPTILVTGGSLKLRNVVIQESTSSSQAAIQITGGTVDLGTAADPGLNTLNVNGSGEFIHDLNTVAVVGDTLEVNGKILTNPSSTVGGTQRITNSSVLSGATFTDANAGDHSADMTAVITWGDNGLDLARLRCLTTTASTPWLVRTLTPEQAPTTSASRCSMPALRQPR